MEKFPPACHLHLMHTSALKRRLIPISDSRTLESYYGKFPIFFKTDVRHNHVSRPQNPLVQKISTFIVHSSSKYLHFFKNCYFQAPLKFPFLKHLNLSFWEGLFLSDKCLYGRCAFYRKLLPVLLVSFRVTTLISWSCKTF